MNRRRSLDDEARWAQAVLYGSEIDRGAVGEDGPVIGEPGWQAAWDELELPPAAGAGPGFARRVALAWANERKGAAAPLLATHWMRAAAAAALVAGAALGSLLSWNTAAATAVNAAAAAGAAGAADDRDGTDGSERSGIEGDFWVGTTLSEEYLGALQAPELALPTSDSATQESQP